MTTAAQNTAIETFTGRYFDYLAPSASDIHIQDLARALAHTCRFGGHTNTYYSVAEHAVYVHDLVIEAGHPELALAALHHDSHEAYVGDVPTPLKRLLGTAYCQIRDTADEAIATWLELPPTLFHHEAVVRADLAALHAEARVLKHSQGVGERWGRDTLADPPDRPLGQPPDVAEAAFLAAHWDARHG